LRALSRTPPAARAKSQKFFGSFFQKRTAYCSFVNVGAPTADDKGAAFFDNTFNPNADDNGVAFPDNVLNPIADDKGVAFRLSVGIPNNDDSGAALPDSTLSPNASDSGAASSQLTVAVSDTSTASASPVRGRAKIWVARTAHPNGGSTITTAAPAATRVA
jgi:hypothetical protein